jgi:hypothetical protein
MFEKAAHQMKAWLSTFGVALIALLAQAVVVHAQDSARWPGGADSPDRPFDAPHADANVAADVGPALLALADVAGAGMEADGGLWLSGNIAGAITYLHWVAGNQPAGLLKLDHQEKVSFDLRLLARAAGVTSESTADQRARIASFVRSDEGLRLLAELTYGSYRYLLHVGSTAPTRAGRISHFGIMNLDNQFDSRINPLRRNGQKMDKECPPEGFDSLVAIDPDVCWFNIDNRRLVPAAQMIFHELAETHARLALALDYLPQGDKPGAHDVAVDREIRLKQERPGRLVTPVGFNLRLASRNDWLRLFLKLDSERANGRNHSE